MVTFFALARLNMNMGFWVLSGIGLVNNLWMACGGRMYYRDHFASLMVTCGYEQGSVYVCLFDKLQVGKCLSV